MSNGLFLCVSFSINNIKCRNSVYDNGKGKSWKKKAKRDNNSAGYIERYWHESESHYWKTENDI